MDEAIRQRSTGSSSGDAVRSGMTLMFDDRPQLVPADGSALEGKPLSERELEVLRLLVTGLSDREIAQELGIARPTVTNHVQHILRKFGVHSRVAATAIAIRLEIV